MEVAADSATAWQIPPFVVLSNIVKHLKDVRDRAAMSSVCRFWRSHTFYWTDVYELVLNHANLDNDYFKFALNGSDYVQTISNKRLSVNGELPLCLRCFFERLTALNKVTLVACDVRTPLIRSLKYFSRKLHLLIITDDYENTTFDPLPDPLALYNKAVPECLQYVQVRYSLFTL
uniref:F-box_5 domain-containing protein n=1 Tax=Ascaris lumbricoides TaxID=6252 RepID=A0A0M3HQD2_ASCLU